MNRRYTIFAESKRPALFAASLACFAAAILLVPSDARSQLNGPVHAAFAGATQPLATPPAPVPPERDAFAPRAILDEDAHPQLPTPPAVPLRLTRTSVALVPPLAPLRVTAIAIGAHPTAIVQRGADPPQLLTAGDAIDGSTIESIDDDSVVLANGRHLLLEPPAAAR